MKLQKYMKAHMCVSASIQPPDQFTLDYDECFVLIFMTTLGFIPPEPHDKST